MAFLHLEASYLSHPNIQLLSLSPEIISFFQFLELVKCKLFTQCLNSWNSYMLFALLKYRPFSVFLLHPFKYLFIQQTFCASFMCWALLSHQHVVKCPKQTRPYPSRILYSSGGKQTNKKMANK